MVDGTATVHLGVQGGCGPAVVGREKDHRCGGERAGYDQTITATFDLPAAPPGVWTVEITPSQGSVCRLVDGMVGNSLEKSAFHKGTRRLTAVQWSRALLLASGRSTVSNAAGRVVGSSRLTEAKALMEV